MSTAESAQSEADNTKSDNTSTGKLRMKGWIFVVLAILGLGIFALSWSQFAPDLAWMAWTKPTVIFFCTIAFLLVSMTVWEAFRPGGGPRVGILRFETTRGDRLFLSLLGSAFIHLAWLGFVGSDLWKALGVSVIYALLVFMFV